jgi:hypothetical protein
VQIARNALTQATAVWAPDKLAETLAEPKSGCEPVSQTPLSAEQFQKLIQNGERQ